MAFEPSREGQLTEQGLGFGYWWVTHKVLVRRAFTVFLGVVAAPLVAYGAYGFADWFFGSGVAERAQMAQMALPAIDYAGFRERTSPREIRIDTPVVLANGEGTFDITARVQNPNQQWWAEFDYGIPGGETRRAFLLPGETRQLSLLGVKAAARPTSGITITGLAWRRVNLHETRPDYATWANARLGITIADAAFEPPKPDDAVRVWRATFTAVNDTAFGYYDMRFVVTLLAGTRIVGVNEVTVRELRPGERRDVAATWFADPSTVTRIEVKPVVNIFDAQSYIPAGR